MAGHIGIVAVSAEGAALCYRTICTESASVLGRHSHPEISVHTHSLAEYIQHIEAGRWQDVGAMLLSSAAKLHKIGAELLICSDNDAVVLGCTEIPLLIGDGDSSLPTLDSTRILARAALREAARARPHR